MAEIYLAGPLFTQAERMWNRRLAEAIERRTGWKVFLPQDESERARSPHGLDFDAVVRICLAGIDASAAVVALLDGPDSDSGTAFECGYAFAQDIPVLGLRTDLREGEDQGLNTMLNRTCRTIVRRPATDDRPEHLEALVDELVAALRPLI